MIIKNKQKWIIMIIVTIHIMQCTSSHAEMNSNWVS